MLVKNVSTATVSELMMELVIRSFRRHRSYAVEWIVRSMAVYYYYHYCCCGWCIPFDNKIWQEPIEWQHRRYQFLDIWGRQIRANIWFREIKKQNCKISDYLCVRSRLARKNCIFCCCFGTDTKANFVIIQCDIYTSEWQQTKLSEENWLFSCACENMHSIRDSLTHLPNAVGNFISRPSSIIMLPSPSIDETAQSMENHSIASTSMSGDDTNSEKSHAIPSSLIKEEWQLILDQDASIEELTNAIERCKELVLNTDECTNERKWLVRHLVELRFRLREMEDADSDTSKLCGSKYKVKIERMSHLHFVSHLLIAFVLISLIFCARQQVILGHHFVDYQAKSIPTTKQHCDNCTGIIWSVVQASYICIDCNFCVHHKCVENVIRVCANVIASERKEPVDEICPENGLSFQQYKCIECNASLSFSKYHFDAMS